MKDAPGLRTVAFAIAVAAAYIAAAKVGFQFAFVAEQISTVWAPTGIAIAALLLWGSALWPAIWLGAFIANATVGVPWWVAAGIATGNTAEAAIAATLLRRVPGFDVTFRTIRNVVAFIIIGAGVSTAVSAAVGVATLCAAAIQPWSRFGTLWTDWWLGDALGALVIAPAILTLARRPQRWTRQDRVETAVLLVGALLTTQLIFGRWSGATGHPLEFVVFPLVIVAAVRLQPAAMALVVFTVSSLAIWHTVRGTGPFAGAEVHQSLVLLQTFMGVLAGTGLLLSAAITEQRTGERRRAAAYAVGEALSRAESLSQSAPAILEGICTNLEWPFGGLWVVDPESDRLKCLAVWVDSSTSAEAFEQVSRTTRFPRGVGLPGRVWATGQPAWVEDVVRDPNFPRAAVARATGLHGAFALPICLGDEVIGVVECFNRMVLPLDKDLLQTMSTLGNQIGQFLGRKRVEQAVADEQRRTRAILDTAIDAVIGMDHQGVVTEFNPAAEQMFGYPADRIVGRELAELIIPPRLRAQHREGLRRYLGTDAGPFMDRRIETTGCHADGHEFPVELAVTRIAGEDPPRFTGFVRDLTARAEADRERERLLLRELTARREAEAANRAKDEFLATLSHELRTPLNAIVGWTHMLLDGTLDEAGMRKALQVIDRNAQLQTQLIADILDVSRIITGGLQLDLRPLDLAGVIGAAVDAVRPAASAKNVQIRSHVAAISRVFEGDPERLQQIVWNLLTNAVKFTPAGGSVEVSVADNESGGVRISVRDDGAGIDPAVLPHVFDRFWQADGSISRRHGGLGLGLAIVRHLVELHGGSVRAESPGPGRGSTFTVELPAMASHQGLGLSVARRPPAVEPASSSRAISLQGCRTLVVDDEDDARQVVAIALRSAGASVRTASSAREALDLLEECPADVLLADLGLPEMDGYGLINEVRKRDLRKGERLAAAAVTAYAGSEDRARALAAGFDVYLAKPIHPNAILEAVHMMWRGHSDLEH